MVCRSDRWFVGVRTDSAKRLTVCGVVLPLTPSSITDVVLHPSFMLDADVNILSEIVTLVGFVARETE